MRTNFDILQLYQLTFGYKAKPFNSQNLSVVVPSGSKFENVTINDFSSVKQSVMGTPIFCPTKLDDWDLPDEPIIKITGSNKIVETDFDGLDGTFKELWSLNDYQLEINGIFISDDDTRYPEEEVRKLRTLCEKRSHIKVVNAIFNIFGVNALAIYDYDFTQVPGEHSMQGYTIKCKSDKAFNLELKKGKIK